ncbi:hypothetical protein EVAR_41306_1 [Eumeta japonica]|uniref:Uncharacterized protein n=1 Tax=Eumeta variegata TaxID=151549 RepID=A0A4C1X2N1_EUMVA|nr:hypothetical protein EVAR_41306_1 [Eumeta japonica]
MRNSSLQRDLRISVECSPRARRARRLRAVILLCELSIVITRRDNSGGYKAADARHCTRPARPAAPPALMTNFGILDWTR